MTKIVLNYRQKRVLEDTISVALEPLPDGHEPEQGCTYREGHNDVIVAQAASELINRPVSAAMVGALRRLLFGELRTVAEITDRRIDARLVAVEAAAKDWLDFERKLRALLIERRFITEDW